MKAISIVLIWSLLYSLVACHTMKQVTQKDEIRNVVENSKSIYLYKNNEKYDFFPPFHYQLAEDTLSGVARILSQSEAASVKEIRIALNDIHQIEYNEFNLEGTICLSALIVAIGVSIYKSFKKKIEPEPQLWFK